MTEWEDFFDAEEQGSQAARIAYMRAVSVCRNGSMYAGVTSRSQAGGYFQTPSKLP